ncbi:MAG: transposase [Gimesia sp.]
MATFIRPHWKALRGVNGLNLAVAERYVQGVSTRKVAKITGELCGFDVISIQVSRAAKLLDEEVETWRNRLLGQVD